MIRTQFKEAPVLETILFLVLENDNEDDLKHHTELESYYKDIVFLKKERERLRERINRYSLTIENMSTALNFYKYLMYQNDEPKTMAEFCQKLLAVDEASLFDIYVENFDRKEPLSREQVFTMIDESLISNDQKWLTWRGFQNLKETTQGLVDLLVDIDAVYQPYYKKYREYVKKYEETFEFERVFDRLSVDVDETVRLVGDNVLNVYVLSPIILTIWLGKFDDENKWYVFVTSINEKFFEKNDVLTHENMIDLLKILGDKTRYEVLLSLMSSEAMKSKDIAKKLNITSAAVSFHISKLSEEYIILAQPSESATKYILNKDRLNKMIDALKRDFQL